MRILGLDPGSRFTGYGIIDRRGSRLEAVEWGRITLPTKTELAARLVILQRELQSLIQRFEPEHAVLESLFRGVNIKSLIVLAQARGVLLTTVASLGLPVAEYSPSEIKMAVTGQGRAEKQQVGRMVRLILGLGNQPASEDATDALAAAICYAQRARIDRLGR